MLTLPVLGMWYFMGT